MAVIPLPRAGRCRRGSGPGLMQAMPPVALADERVMAAGWLARPGLRVSTGGADGANTTFAAGAVRAAVGLAAVAGLQPASQAGLPGAISSGAGGVHGDCCVVASHVEPLLARCPQASSAERRYTRCDTGPAGRCLRSVVPGRAHRWRYGQATPLSGTVFRRKLLAFCVDHRPDQAPDSTKRQFDSRPRNPSCWS